MFHAARRALALETGICFVQDMMQDLFKYCSLLQQYNILTFMHHISIQKPPVSIHSVCRFYPSHLNPFANGNLGQYSGPCPLVDTLPRYKSLYSYPSSLETSSMNFISKTVTQEQLVCILNFFQDGWQAACGRWHLYPLDLQYPGPAYMA